MNDKIIINDEDEVKQFYNDLMSRSLDVNKDIIANVRKTTKAATAAVLAIGKEIDERIRLQLEVTDLICKATLGISVNELFLLWQHYQEGKQ